MCQKLRKRCFFIVFCAIFTHLCLSPTYYKIDVRLNTHDLYIIYFHKTPLNYPTKRRGAGFTSSFFIHIASFSLFQNLLLYSKNYFCKRLFYFDKYGGLRTREVHNQGRAIQSTSRGRQRRIGYRGGFYSKIQRDFHTLVLA